MRRLILVFIFLAGLWLAAPAQAQSDLVLDNLEIGLWPEYDRADVLVIYQITLPPEVSLPAQMSIRIPRDVGEPYNLAMKDMDGLLYNQRAYVYKVNQTQVVEPTQVEVLANTQEPVVTLISCYPYLVDNQRIVITAILDTES